MRHFSVLVVLSVLLYCTLNASDNVPRVEKHSEALIVLGMSPSELETPATGEQTEYTISLLCPNCHKIMYAKFKKGYTSMTTAKCEKCYKRYVIKYNWPSDHKEPTIREIKESK